MELPGPNWDVHTLYIFISYTYFVSNEKQKSRRPNMQYRCSAAALNTGLHV